MVASLALGMDRWEAKRGWEVGFVFFLFSLVSHSTRLTYHVHSTLVWDAVSCVASRVDCAGTNAACSVCSPQAVKPGMMVSLGAGSCAFCFSFS